MSSLTLSVGWIGLSGEGQGEGPQSWKLYLGLKRFVPRLCFRCPTVPVGLADSDADLHFSPLRSQKLSSRSNPPIMAEQAPRKSETSHNGLSYHPGGTLGHIGCIVRRETGGADGVGEPAEQTDGLLTVNAYKVRSRSQVPARNTDQLNLRQMASGTAGWGLRVMYSSHCRSECLAAHLEPKPKLQVPVPLRTEVLTIGARC